MERCLLVAFLMVELLMMESHALPLGHCQAPSYRQSFVNVHHLSEIFLSDYAISPNHSHRKRGTTFGEGQVPEGPSRPTAGGLGPHKVVVVYPNNSDEQV